VQGARAQRQGLADARTHGHEVVRVPSVEEELDGAQQLNLDALVLNLLASRGRDVHLAPHGVVGREQRQRLSLAALALHRHGRARGGPTGKFHIHRAQRPQHALQEVGHPGGDVRPLCALCCYASPRLRLTAPRCRAPAAAHELDGQSRQPTSSDCAEDCGHLQRLGEGAGVPNATATSPAPACAQTARVVVDEQFDLPIVAPWVARIVRDGSCAGWRRSPSAHPRHRPCISPPHLLWPGTQVLCFTRAVPPCSRRANRRWF